MTKETPYHLNLQSVTIGWPFGSVPGEEATLKARCRLCWSPVDAKSDATHRVIELNCRRCGGILQGDDADQEYRRMFQEQAEAVYALNGQLAKSSQRVGQGPFLWVTLPPLEREPRTAFEHRVKANSGAKTPSGRIGRGQFPLGAPGLLFTQARLFTEGLNEVPGFEDGSIGVFPHSERSHAGTLTLSYPKEQIERGPKYREEQMMAKMGANMIAAMSSAFACELVMKAICLTAKNDALKSHDLVDLYAELPDQSQKRVEFYCPEIRATMEQGKDRFGKWRYFEMNSREEAIASLVQTGLSRSLLKSARVLLDEAEILGLSGGVKVEAKQDIQVADGSRLENYQFNLSVFGSEAPRSRT